jgi:hypothetical protein
MHSITDETLMPVSSLLVFQGSAGVKMGPQAPGPAVPVNPSTLTIETRAAGSDRVPTEPIRGPSRPYVSIRQS